jgi:chromosome partitioning protein
VFHVKQFDHSIKARVVGEFDASTPLASEVESLTHRRLALRGLDVPRPRATRVFAVSNQKGGVGKTTTTVNLAAAFAYSGARVVVIDLDPQRNASTALGMGYQSDNASIYDAILGNVPLSDVVRKSPEFEALYCVPATLDLAGAEIELVSLVAREQRLRRSLDTYLAAVSEPVDYIMIDCPPSLGLLTVNALVAAKEILIPIQCEYYALEGVSQLLVNIELVKNHLNPQLQVSTILLTMYDPRTNLANQVVHDVREHFPTQTLRSVIPRSVRISEAPSYGQSVVSYDPSSVGSVAYQEAAVEIAQRAAVDECDEVLVDIQREGC